MNGVTPAEFAVLPPSPPRLALRTDPGPCPASGPGQAGASRPRCVCWLGRCAAPRSPRLEDRGAVTLWQGPSPPDGYDDIVLGSP